MTGIAAGAARAEVIYGVVPTASVGATDNAAVAPTPQTPTAQTREGDGFDTVSLSASASYRRPLSTHTLATLIGYTSYLQHAELDSFSTALTWTSNVNLTPRLELTGGASAGYARTSYTQSDPTLVTPQASSTGANQFLNTAVNQGLTYQPTGKRSYLETINAAQVRYIDAPTGLPTTTTVAALVKGSLLAARDAYSVDVQLADTYSPADPLVPRGRFGEGHTFLGQVRAGWRHDFSPFWAGEGDAGPVALFKLTGPAVIAPGATLSLSYRNSPWFAVFTLAQAPAANLFVGQATINDQALARLALPLRRDDTLFVAGFGGYIYARIASDQGTLGKAFDLWTAGASLTARPSRLPMTASLLYTFIDQHSGSLGSSVSNLTRNTVMLTVGGLFSWGPGTPPLFGGKP